MANFNFNKVMLGGRLTADPELKTTANNIPVVSFSIAVNRNFRSKDAQQQADFFNVTAWRSTAEIVSRFFRKGSSIFVVGTIQNRSWTDQQGQKRYVTEVIADECLFAGNSGNGQSEGGTFYGADAGSAAQGATAKPAAATFEELSTEDDLPF